MTYLRALARSIRRNWGWLALTAVLASVIVVDESREAERVADHEARLAGVVFSRADIEDVQTFKDESVMHGPRSFYFKARETDVARLLHWLDAEPQQAIPDWLVGRVELVKAQAGWSFDWAAPRVYANMYCSLDKSETLFDLVLVDGQRVVYMTTGRNHPGSRSGRC